MEAAVDGVVDLLAPAIGLDQDDLLGPASIQEMRAVRGLRLLYAQCVQKGLTMRVLSGEVTLAVVVDKKSNPVGVKRPQRTDMREGPQEFVDANDLSTTDVGLLGGTPLKLNWDAIAKLSQPHREAPSDTPSSLALSDEHLDLIRTAVTEDGYLPCTVRDGHLVLQSKAAEVLGVRQFGKTSMTPSLRSDLTAAFGTPLFKKGSQLTVLKKDLNQISLPEGAASENGFSHKLFPLPDQRGDFDGSPYVNLTLPLDAKATLEECFILSYRDHVGNDDTKAEYTLKLRFYGYIPISCGGYLELQKERLRKHRLRGRFELLFWLIIGYLYFKHMFVFVFAPSPALLIFSVICGVLPTLCAAILLTSTSRFIDQLRHPFTSKKRAWSYLLTYEELHKVYYHPAALHSHLLALHSIGFALGIFQIVNHTPWGLWPIDGVSPALAWWFVGSDFLMMLCGGIMGALFQADLSILHFVITIRSLAVGVLFPGATVFELCAKIGSLWLLHVAIFEICRFVQKQIMQEVELLFSSAEPLCLHPPHVYVYPTRAVPFQENSDRGIPKKFGAPDVPVRDYLFNPGMQTS